MERKKAITACAASCGLHARVCVGGGGVRWWGVGTIGWGAVSDTLSSRQATTDMTYCSFIPFTALRKWRGTEDSLHSGHQLSEAKRNAAD